ncbi:unnamed protein product [Trichobilharzia szidati]|nr:unnamed protein product [Trichobilharzia szidati]
MIVNFCSLPHLPSLFNRKQKIFMVESVGDFLFTHLNPDTTTVEGKYTCKEYEKNYLQYILEISDSLFLNNLNLVAELCFNSKSHCPSYQHFHQCNLVKCIEDYLMRLIRFTGKRYKRFLKETGNKNVYDRKRLKMTIKLSRKIENCQTDQLNSIINIGVHPKRNEHIPNRIQLNVNEIFPQINIMTYYNIYVNLHQWTDELFITNEIIGDQPFVEANNNNNNNNNVTPFSDPSSTLNTVSFNPVNIAIKKNQIIMMISESLDCSAVNHFGEMDDADDDSHEESDPIKETEQYYTKDAKGLNNTSINPHICLCNTLNHNDYLRKHGYQTPSLDDYNKSGKKMIDSPMNVSVNFPRNSTLNKQAQMKFMYTVEDCVIDSVNLTMNNNTELQTFEGGYFNMHSGKATSVSDRFSTASCTYTNMYAVETVILSLSSRIAKKSIANRNNLRRKYIPRALVNQRFLLIGKYVTELFNEKLSTKQHKVHIYEVKAQQAKKESIEHFSNCCEISQHTTTTKNTLDSNVTRNPINKINGDMFILSPNCNDSLQLLMDCKQTSVKIAEERKNVEAVKDLRLHRFLDSQMPSLNNLTENKVSSIEHHKEYTNEVQTRHKDPLHLDSLVKTIHSPNKSRSLEEINNLKIFDKNEGNTLCETRSLPNLSSVKDNIKYNQSKVSANLKNYSTMNKNIDNHLVVNDIPSEALKNRLDFKSKKQSIHELDQCSFNTVSYNELDIDHLLVETFPLSVGVYSPQINSISEISSVSLDQLTTQNNIYSLSKLQVNSQAVHNKDNNADDDKMVVQNVGDNQQLEEVHHFQNQYNELNRTDEKISNPVKCNKSTQINAYSLHNQFKHFFHTKNAREPGEILFTDDVHSYPHCYYYYAERKQQRQQQQQLKEVKNDHLEIDKENSNKVQLPKQKSLHLKINGLKLYLNNNPALRSTILNSHNNCGISDLDETNNGKIQTEQKYSRNSVKQNNEILGRTPLTRLSMTPSPILTTPLLSRTRQVEENHQKDYKFKQKKLFQHDGDNNETCEACNKSRLTKRNGKILGEKFNYLPLLKLEVTPTIDDTIVDLTLNIETNKSGNIAGSRSSNNNNINSNNKDQTIAKPKMECDGDDDDATKSTDQRSLTSESVKTRQNVTKNKNSKQSLRYALKSLSILPKLSVATRLTTQRLKRRIKSVIIKKPFQGNSVQS